nr:hypothetical protein [Variovorax boronicumulans]
MRIDGPQPTHHDERAGQAALFMDGRAATSQNASAQLFADACIGAGHLLASLALPLPMHGFAEPNGAHLITSWRDPANSGPTQIEVYRRQGAGYGFVDRLEAPCPGMHGSYTQGTIAGHPALARFVDIGNSGTPSTTRLDGIDPVTHNATPITMGRPACRGCTTGTRPRWRMTTSPPRRPPGSPRRVSTPRRWRRPGRAAPRRARSRQSNARWCWSCCWRATARARPTTCWPTCAR